ncbi:hypothetical protein E4T56_gene10229 [Termitomyces sp. T112]|nr:hypothetical protein E4T56_gene10229 [Termitomyces sp. T112]
MPPPLKKSRLNDQGFQSAEENTSSVEFNTGFIFNIPFEIWHEIFSHLTSRPIPYCYDFVKCALERKFALRALSQTCRKFRNHFLWEQWNTVEIYPPDQTFPAVFIDQSMIRPFRKTHEILQYKCQGLIQTPELGAYVRKMTVSLETRRCTPEILEDLARCLHSLPNLHTFQITDAPSPMRTRLKNVFSRHRYPKVHTVSIPRFAHHILASFPDVKTIISNRGEGGPFLTPIAKGCFKVENLEGFTPDTQMMRRLIKTVPNLKRIKFVASSDSLDLDILRMLSSFKHLCEIELRAPSNMTPTRINENYRLKVSIEIARKILQSQDRPRLVLHYRPYRSDFIQPWSMELDVYASPVGTHPGRVSATTSRLRTSSLSHGNSRP